MQRPEQCHSPGHLGPSALTQLAWLWGPGRWVDSQATSPSECWAAGSVGPSQARGFGGRLSSAGGSDTGARLGGKTPRVVLLLLLRRPPPSRSVCLSVCLPVSISLSLSAFLCSPSWVGKGNEDRKQTLALGGGSWIPSLPPSSLLPSLLLPSALSAASGAERSLAGGSLGPPARLSVCLVCLARSLPPSLALALPACEAIV